MELFIARLERDEYKPFSWLVCVDDPSISLPIVNPFLVDAKYKAISSNGELKSIGLDSISIDQVYAVVTVGDNIGQVSVNLKSPIIINKKRSLGKQNILLDSTYSLKHPILAGSHTN